MILKLDFNSTTPVYQQIRNQIVLGIANGELKPGEKLPTIRALASESGVNMMTVNKSYQLLKQEGFIITDRRSGAMVRGEICQTELSEQTLEELRLLISQIKLSGMDKTHLLELCERLYDGKENEL